MTEKRKNVPRDLARELKDLQAKGITLPRNYQAKVAAAGDYRSMVSTPGQLQKDASAYFDRKASPEVQSLQKNAEVISAMRRSRNSSAGMGMNKLGSMGGDVMAALPRFYDPMEYWDLSGLPWNMADEGHRHKLHKWMRLYYSTHYLVKQLVEIYSRFPLAGLRIESKDRKITSFYEDEFLDKLNYEEFLYKIGREVFTVGECFPLGSFNESMGVWEREELLNPENIVIEKFPLMGTQQLKVHLPESLRRLAQTKSPAAEYKQLQINYEHLIPYALRGEPFPVSDVMLKHIATPHTDWDDHGTPIMLGILRTLLHEEKLLASQDAIAERLYSPLILAKLGVNEMGGDMGPWMPSPDQLDSFRDDMDIALASDFRLMVYHYALDIQNVFGREQVPDLGNDFDRIERRIMQGFGVNPSLLSAGSNAQPYASSALQAEFMNQQMKTYQNYLKRFFTERAQVVAEAQGHYDYEKRGNTRVPIMEEVIEYDEEGTPYIVEKHKLIDINLQFENFNMRDEATERQFLQSLRQMGVPISDGKLMLNVGFDFKDSLDELSEEMVQKTVAQQQAKLQTYKILQTQGLPIPPDLKAEVESTNAPATPDASGGMGGMAGGPPPGGIGDMSAPGGADIGAPSASGAGGIVMPPMPPGALPTGGSPPYPASSSDPAGSMGARPPISDERRPGMPKPVGASFAALEPEEVDRRLASLNETILQLELRKRERRIKQASQRTVVDPNEPELEWDMRRTARVVIDRVPPAFRRNLRQL